MSNSSFDRKELEELVILDSLGVIDVEQERRLARLLEESDEDVLWQIEQYREVCAFVGMAEAPVAPPTELKARIFQVIESDGIEVIESSEGWIAHALPGVRYKTLHETNEKVTVLIEMQRDSQFPHHEHAGDEECYIVRGSLVEGDQQFREGDFIFAAGGTSHGPLTTPNGCTVLLGLTPDDYRSMTA